jgi:hypothetical protein
MSWLFNSAIDWLTHLILDGFNSLWTLLLQQFERVPTCVLLTITKGRCVGGQFA